MALALLLVLLGCNDAGNVDVTRVVTGGLLTDRMLGLGQPTEPDRMAIAERESDEGDGTPFLRMALGRREATASLMQTQGQRRLWRAAGGVVVATDGARVVATSGLPQMVMATRFDGPDPLEDPKSLIGRSAEARRLVDIAGAARPRHDALRPFLRLPPARPPHGGGAHDPRRGALPRPRLLAGAQPLLGRRAHQPDRLRPAMGRPRHRPALARLRGRGRRP
jgi:hypothetical protein